MATTDSSKSTSRTGLAILLSLAIAATGGSVVAASANDAADDPGKSARPHDEAGGMLMDGQFMVIADRIPEFGGMFVDEEAKTLFVHVTNRKPGIKKALRRAIRDVFPHRALPARIRLLDARFSYEQLMRWHKSAGVVFAIPGVTQTDIDDRANRLSIGVAARGLEGVLEQELTAVGVPPEGWQVEEAQPVEPLASLNDFHRPPLGGLEIGRRTFFGSCQVACTYGFTAIRADVGGFITASHCTNTQGGVESTQFVQPCSDGGVIGTETVDPDFFTNASDSNCPGVCGFGVSVGPCSCRYSDSAFVRRASGVGVARLIVRNSLGSLSWDGTSRLPVFREIGPVVGQTVRKVGRSTGHTLGIVTSTCTNVGLAESRRLILCQATAPGLEPGPGDSGSPIFRTIGCTLDGSNLCSQLIGILWGGNGAFSPIANIQRNGELGPLETCYGGGC